MMPWQAAPCRAYGAAEQNYIGAPLQIRSNNPEGDHSLERPYMSTSENIATAAFREVLDDFLLAARQEKNAFFTGCARKKNDTLQNTEAAQDAGAAIQSVLQIHDKYHSVHALLAVAAYNPSFFSEETCKHGYLLDEELSTRCVAVYVRKEPQDVVLSVRGTVLEPTDLVADLSLAYGFRSLIPRFTRAKRVCKKTIKKYGKSHLSVVGHSLGAQIAIDLCRKFDLPGTAFQPGVALIGLGSEIAWNLFRRYILKKPPQVKIVCTKGFDPLACLAPFTCAGDVIYVDVKHKKKQFFARTIHFVCPCLSVSRMVYETHRMDNFLHDT